MKVRIGFVTNSSSSNFLVALRGEKKLLLASDVFDVFGVELTSPLTKQLGKEVFRFAGAAEKVTNSYLNKLEDEWGEVTIAGKAREFREKGWKVFHVYIDMNKIPMFRCLPEQSETEVLVLWSLDAYRIGEYEN